MLIYSQSGFCVGHSCADKIYVMRALMWTALAMDRIPLMWHFAQAFDTCDLQCIPRWELEKPLKLRRLLHVLYSGAKYRARELKGSRSRQFPIWHWVCQGDTWAHSSSWSFSTWFGKGSRNGCVCGVTVGLTATPELSHADDIGLWMSASTGCNKHYIYYWRKHWMQGCNYLFPSARFFEW